AGTLGFALGSAPRRGSITGYRDRRRLTKTQRLVQLERQLPPRTRQRGVDRARPFGAGGLLVAFTLAELRRADFLRLQEIMREVRVFEEREILPFVHQFQLVTCLELPVAALRQLRAHG